MPLPVLVYRLTRPALAAEDAALWVPQLEPFRLARHERNRPPRAGWPLALAAFCWLLLVTATARPQWLGNPVEVPVSGRELIMAVDLSRLHAYRRL